MRKILCTILLFTLSCGFGLSASQPQTFPDVPPSHPFYSQIETVNAAGIMVGWDGLFHPDDALARAQAAIILEKAAFNVTYPPHFSTTLFDDVSGKDYFQNWVEDFGRRGVTSGCGTRLFCPYDGATREQIAVFIIRSKGIFCPPMPAIQRFADVPPSSPYYAYIDQMAALGISAGCGDGNYCPGQAVTRGQMAVFIVNAFGLK